MSKSVYTLSVIMPALNEEKNISLAVTNTLKAFDDFEIKGELIVINDGSTDNTAKIVNQLMKKDQRIKIINHDQPKGIGASFWEGVDNVCGKIVSMFPGDNENDPWEILRYYELLNHVDLVIPFVFNKEVRSYYRNILSLIYRFIINTTFFVNFNYTNGTILYRKSILEEITDRSTGFFFQTDILVRAVKAGYLFAEVPYRLGVRDRGISKAVTFPSLINVIKGYLHLTKEYYSNNTRKSDHEYSHDSLTFKRYQ